MTVNMELVKKGISEPREGLMQQGQYQVTLGRQHEAVLAEHGWPRQETDQLEADTTALSASVEDQSAQRGFSSGATGSEVAARTDVKTFLRILREALPRALRLSPASGVTAESFHVGGKLGRSTPKLNAHLTKIRPGVIALDAVLARFFKGQSAVAYLDRVQAMLTSADAVQEVAVADLPLATLQVYECKGRVLQGIEDLNASGRIAFDGQAEMVAMFNKDLLLRARKKRAKKPEGISDTLT